MSGFSTSPVFCFSRPLALAVLLSPCCDSATNPAFLCPFAVFPAFWTQIWVFCAFLQFFLYFSHKSGDFVPVSRFFLYFGHKFGDFVPVSGRVARNYH